MGEDTKYCGHCKREVSAVNFTTHTVHCQRNIAVCSMCNEPVPVANYQQHIETNHKSVPCPKCLQQLEPLQLFSHEKDDCPKRMITCNHCELDVTATDFDRHKEYCEARTERCKGCTKYVQARYLQFHYETDHKYLKPEDKERAEENSDDEGSECPICLGPVTLPLPLECGHVFCMVCVKGIANTTKNCAICRRDITRDMLMDIRFCREEDIIKNYCNKPPKKTLRSQSVPSRSTSTTSSGRRLVHHTTEEYDEMVSHLMSNRTATTTYRYQRPSNTHTPPSYTPYSSSSNTSTTNTVSCQDSYKDSAESCKDSFKDDDCCCSSNSTSSSSTAQTSRTSTSNVFPSAPTTTTSSLNRRSSLVTLTSTPTQRASRDSSSKTTSTAPPTRASSLSRALPPSYAARSSSNNISRTSISSSTATSSNSTSLAPTNTKSSSSTNSTSTLSNTTSQAEVSSSASEESSSIYRSSSGARPRRPTSLALETTAVLSTLSAETTSPRSITASDRKTSTNTEPPENATQEQYDRWLAFQLAKSDDDLPPAVFNEKHKPTFRRSFSMPERPDNCDSDSSTSSEDESDSPTSGRSSRRPPASPRSINSSSSSSSSASSSTRSTPISKSSSDSNASSSSGSSSSAMSTGARPKSTGLRKRVSFKEDAPIIRREVPVLLPCEFCNEMFPERDLMRHQTSCEQNETQLPRASRLAQLASVNSSLSNSTSNLSRSNSNSRVNSNNSSPTSLSSLNTQNTTGPASPPPRRRQGRMPTPVCTPPKKGTAPFPTESPPTPVRRNQLKSSRQNSSEAFSPPPSVTPPPFSPPPTTTITIVDRSPPVVASPSLSSGSSRPFSISPASSTSTNSSANGGSYSSSSTTPSTSSSASPIPVNMSNPPDTPTTDIEFEYDEEVPFSRPRKGRLLSSAIIGWRSISGNANARRGGYVRSNTCPLEDTCLDDSSPTTLQPNVSTSHSATQLPVQNSPDTEAPASPYPQITRSPSPSKRPVKQISPPPHNSQIQNENNKESKKDISSSNTNNNQNNNINKTNNNINNSNNNHNQNNNTSNSICNQEQNESVFIKKTRKYKAPLPPTTKNNDTPSTQRKSPSPPTKQNSVIMPPPKNQVRSSTPQNTPSKSDGTKSAPNGFLRFDSKPMMNNMVPPKENEIRIMCEFCKEVFTSEKFRGHQTMCEAALRPVSRLAMTPVEQVPVSKSPLPVRHNKGPAPPPPPESCPPDIPFEAKLEKIQKPVKKEKTSKSEKKERTEKLEKTDKVEKVKSIKSEKVDKSERNDKPEKSDNTEKPSAFRRLDRLERSHSVKDDRTSFRDGVRVSRRLERAGSIKESRSSLTSSNTNLYTTDDNISAFRRWKSKEILSTGIDSPTSYHSWGSSNNLYTGYTSSSGSHAWSSHINMVRDDLRSRSTTSYNTYQDNGGDSDNGGETEVDTEMSSTEPRSRSRYFSSMMSPFSKATLNNFAFEKGGVRYRERERSTSRTRPSSMFTMSSSGWGSMFDLSSPTRTFNISDAFSSASLACKRRYIR